MLILNTLKYLLLIGILLKAFLSINGHEWMIDRIEVAEFNKKFLKNVTFNLVTFSRRKRVVNYYSENLLTLDNNTTVSAIYEEFINNEYRTVFMGLQFKLCDFLESPYLLLKKKFGVECPVKPNIYKLNNVTIHLESVPNLFPFKRGRIICTFMLKATNEVVVVTHIYTRVL